MNPHLHRAAEALGNAAHRHRQLADQSAALATLARSIGADADKPMPVEDLAQALLPLDLCIVHRESVRQLLEFLKTGDDSDGLSNSDIHTLIKRLELSLKGRAQ